MTPAAAAAIIKQNGAGAAVAQHPDCCCCCASQSAIQRSYDASCHAKHPYTHVTVHVKACCCCCSWLKVLPAAAAARATVWSSVRITPSCLDCSGKLLQCCCQQVAPP
jgi:hypothetical protein